MTDYDPKAPTRKELASFLPTPQLIRAFEQLFEKVPSDLTDLQDQVYEVADAVGDAIAKSDNLLATMVRIADSLDTLTSAPPSPPIISEDDVSPPSPPIISEDDVSPPHRTLIVIGDVVDVNDRGKANNDILTWNSTTKQWTTSSTVTSTIKDSTANLIASTVNLTNGAAAAVGTLNNAPAAGDPTKWVPVDDNGTIRYTPLW